MLTRVESTLAAIKTRLLNDETLRKLLFHDSNNALNMLAPHIKETEKYITLKPIFEFENKEEYNQNSIINIYVTEIIPTDEEVSLTGILQINVACNIDIWDLIDNKIRPLQICNRIIKLLNNKKFTISNKLILSNMTDLIINKKMIGYALLFEITDGSGENNNF